MLGLKLPTDPRWVNIVEKNLSEILTDHAWCEQKAATNAINLVINNPEKTDLVKDMLSIAQEELQHFEMVHNIIIERGYTLGHECRDEYVNDLLKFCKVGGTKTDRLIDRLLFAAMIEARSCERFRILSTNINDKELAQFYHDLMASEANHYTVFLNYARKYGEGRDVNARWQEWLNYEAEVIANYGKSETMHG
ncbi:MAG: tRNA-(ms[2]io[6]A)-hydroxylase [Crocinitomicaceae bacterium]|jgi:tRNA-(ms[2]io[6]A)-hydroxylase|nr:tRNA-(ms[2]io[6]A)-hydroxylase [Crocinitomicaceae bacterium]